MMLDERVSANIDSLAVKRSVDLLQSVAGEGIAHSVDMVERAHWVKALVGDIGAFLMSFFFSQWFLYFLSLSVPL